MIVSAADRWAKFFMSLGALCLILGLTACSNPHQRVILETELGEIEIAVYEDKAPLTAADFLYYVDNGLYNNEGFYRAVRPETDPRNMDMQLIQGGRLDVNRVTAEVPHEPTTLTGLTHKDGAVSIARGDVDTGSAAYFFISIGDNTILDAGGARLSDGQGFAVFGHVTRGMDVVRAIQARETTIPTGDPLTNGQYLNQPVRINAAKRK